MKRLFWLYTLLILVGCTEEAIEGTQTQAMGKEEFYASFEGVDSRTYVDEQIRLRWTANDSITLFKKNTYNRTYMFTGKTGANAGGFKQVSVDDEFWYGADVDYNYAVYPHSADNTLDETDLFLTVNMPAEQTYVENSFGLKANTMVAVSESGQLMFKNVGSYLRVRLYGENTAISSITLTSNSEAIAGEAKITPSLDEVPTCEMTGSGKSIRLTCPTPVTISSDADAPTVFWIVVPPVTLANGFSVTVENSEGNTQVFDVAQSFTFERNTYYNLTREVSITSDIPYVTFTAEETQTLTMSKAVETLEYSVNGGDWSELGTNTVTFGGEYGNLRLRGKSLTGTANTSDDYSQISFGNDISVACLGDIRTLIDYENYATVDTKNARFCCLFKNCSALVLAPELSTMTLADWCYYGMFQNCVNLTVAPELPATTLEGRCYGHMFSGCSSLTTAPKLPATHLAAVCYTCMFKDCVNLMTAPILPATILGESCYQMMFQNCINLIDAPDLPATTLAVGCYYWMFKGCINLVNAPGLPATTLAPHCYESMFRSCTNLVKAPRLSASTLIDYCYAYMFYDCLNLNSITMLATDISAEYCLHQWTYGLSSSGTFVKAKDVESLYISSSGIPSGWTIKNYGETEEEIISNNQIWYTSTDGNVVTPYATDVFGATIVSNVYEGGKGIITFDEDITQIGDKAFYHCTTLKRIQIPDIVTQIKVQAFYQCSELLSIKIPTGVTEFGTEVFMHCHTLDSITIPDGVTKISGGLFDSCYKLSYLKIPDTITEIGTSAFYACKSLTSFDIPVGVTAIKSHTFAVCFALSSITIPESVTAIGDMAFYNCPVLKTIKCKAVTPPSLGTSTFTASNNSETLLDDMVIYVPSASAESYIEVWNDYAAYIQGTDF